MKAESEEAMTKQYCDYYYYWGKAKGEATEAYAYHLLPYHCLDVAAVGSVLLHPSSTLITDLAEFLDEDAESLSRLMVLILVFHDLGKFASAFQALYREDGHYLVQPKTPGLRPYDSRQFRHDTLGWFFWKKLSRLVAAEVDVPSEVLEVLVLSSFGHHGKPIPKKGIAQMRRYTESQNELAAEHFVKDTLELLGISESPFKFVDLDSKLARLEQVSWHLAGAFVLCDWLGSDTAYFPYLGDPGSCDLAEYWRLAKDKANGSVSASGLRPNIRVRGFGQFSEEFGFPPTPLQSWAQDVVLDQGPQLFVLEDTTGAGKTEAAMTLVHRLMANGVADGFYFGLPTMATSDAMFSRILKWYSQLFVKGSDSPSIVLAHGASEMNEQFQDIVISAQAVDENYTDQDQSASKQCTNWLADSRKRALLAPIGVGTIDQALIATLPRRHQSLRLLGLHRKILIVDEVHAADEYMLELLVSLLTAHRLQGGSCVLLSATLPNVYREKLTAAWREGDIEQQQLDQAFPLATKVSVTGTSAFPLAAASKKSLKVQFIHDRDNCINLILGAVEAGKCVAWIRNSVDDATEAYTALKQQMHDANDVTLFHSRFVLSDRQKIQSGVLGDLGKVTASDGSRHGRVVVSTQVLQESLDIDVDVLISDICPIDGLLQRAGRLCRHRRTQDGELTEGVDQRGIPTLYVHAPEWDDSPEESWLREAFRNTQSVYRYPGRLWIGMKILREKGEICLPDDARELIEQVYASNDIDRVPEGLKNSDDAAYGDSLSKTKIAKSRVLDWRYSYGASIDSWYEDYTDIGTRFADVESEQVVLVRKTNSELVPWVEVTKYAIRLSTVTLPLSRSKHLAEVPHHEEASLQQFRDRFRLSEYIKIWMPEADSEYAYSAELGVVKCREERSLQ